jgi:hypothetical protein
MAGPASQSELVEGFDSESSLRADDYPKITHKPESTPKILDHRTSERMAVRERLTGLTGPAAEAGHGAGTHRWII